MVAADLLGAIATVVLVVAGIAIIALQTWARR